MIYRQWEVLVALELPVKEQFLNLSTRGILGRASLCVLWVGEGRSAVGGALCNIEGKSSINVLHPSDACQEVFLPSTPTWQPKTSPMLLNVPGNKRTPLRITAFGKMDNLYNILSEESLSKRTSRGFLSFRGSERGCHYKLHRINEIWSSVSEKRLLLCQAWENGEGHKNG